MKPTVFTRKELAKQLRLANISEISRQTGVGRLTLMKIRDEREVLASSLETVSAFYLRQMEDAA